MQKIVYKNIRVMILNDKIIRIEYKKNNTFLNDPTFFIPNLNNFDEKFNFNFEENDKGLVVYINDNMLFIPSNQDGLKNVRLYNKNKLEYSYKKHKNTGELPRVNKTPYVYVISDNPRIILPKEGYTFLDEENNGYIIQKNVQDIYLLLCNYDHKLLRKLYTDLTGHSEFVRLSTLGSWNSKWFMYDETSAKALIEDYKKNDMPLDNMVIDTDWRRATELGIGYDINEKLFPDLKRFFNYAHQNNIEIMFNDHPEPYQNTTSVFDPNEVKYRETNLRNILELGLDYWWYDRNWRTKLNTPVKEINCETFGFYLFSDITKHHYQKIANDEKKYTRPIMMGNVNNINNGKYLGIKDSASHRYSIQWTGDINSGSDNLKTEITNLIRGGENEITYINFDCGGHMGQPEKELYISWMQFGCFSPIFRPHCTRNRYREPWVYDDETVDIVRNYILMRYRLLPNIYKACYQNYLDGNPLTKSLSYIYPNDKNLEKIQDEYFFTDDILVAPKYNDLVRKVKKYHYLDKVHAEYFANKELKGNPCYVTDYDVLHKHWFNESPDGVMSPYNFSAKYETTLKFSKDVYLIVESDDGIRVYIDGKKTYEDWNDHGEIKQIAGKLSKNEEHKIVIEYYQALGGATIKLFYQECNLENYKFVTLPKGNWLDVFSGKMVSSKKQYKRKYDLKEFPLFVKPGSIFILAENANNTKEQSWEHLTYDFYPSKDKLIDEYLYEDDRKTTAYKVGEYNISSYKTLYDKSKNIISLFIEPKKGEYNGKYAYSHRDINIKYHLLRGVSNIDKVLVNGKEIDYIISNKDKNVYPFSTGTTCCSSKVLYFKLDINTSKEYKIDFVLKKSR